MTAPDTLIPNNILERKPALERIPVLSSASALPIPSTPQDIEHYVHTLLTGKEEAACAMATD